MNYKEYYETYYNYRQAIYKLHKIQNKLFDIINAMLSTTAQMKEDVGSSRSNSNDKMLSLTAKKIELEAQEVLAKELVEMHNKRRISDEEELRKSKDTKDIVYIMYFIDHLKVSDISRKLNYVKSYIYNVLSEIRKAISEIDKEHRSEKNSKKT